MRPEEATRTLILAHRTELVDQAVLHCRRSYPDATIEVEMGNKTASGKADITVASLLSIVSKSRIEKFDPASFKLILIDEAHHAVSQTYLQTLDHFGVLNMEQGDPAEKPILVGVSATLSRTDGLALGKVLDHIVYHRSAPLSSSLLPPPSFLPPSVSLSLFSPPSVSPPLPPFPRLTGAKTGTTWR